LGKVKRVTAEELVAVVERIAVIRASASFRLEIAEGRPITCCRERRN
jgi:hypothetical protein